MNYTSLSDGTYFYNVTIYDLAGNSNTSGTRNITLDSTASQINFAPPTLENSTTISRNWIDVNVTINETNFVNITFRLFNNTRGIINTSVFNTSTQTIINYTNLTEGMYFYNVTIQDAVGNSNATETRNISLDLPNLVFISPTDSNNERVGRNYTFINVSVIGTLNISVCTLEWTNTTGNAINTTMTMSSNGTSIYCYYNQSVPVDGNYTYKVYGNESDNDIQNTSYYTLTFDTTAPAVISSSPSGTVTSSSTTLSATTNENASCRYSTTSGTAYANITNNFTQINTTHTTSLSGLTDGAKSYYVRCNDTIGNINSSDYTVSFTVSIPSTETTGSSGGGSTTPKTSKASYSFDQITPVSPVEIIDIEKKLDTGLVSIEIIVKETVQSVTITIEDRNNANPVSLTPSGVVYQYLSIVDNVNNSKIESSKLTFAVEKSWISANGIDELHVYMQMYSNDQWQKYIGTKTSENDTHVFYEVSVPSLASNYAITGDKKSNECSSGKRCNGNNLQECSGGFWTTKESCQNGCDEQKFICNSELPVGADCVSGNRKCDGNSLELCAGGKWISEKTCEFGCNSQKQACSLPGEAPTIPIPMDFVYIGIVLGVVILAGFLYYRVF